MMSRLRSFFGRLLSRAPARELEPVDCHFAALQPEAIALLRLHANLTTVRVAAARARPALRAATVLLFVAIAAVLAQGVAAAFLRWPS